MLKDYVAAVMHDIGIKQTILTVNTKSNIIMNFTKREEIDNEKGSELREVENEGGFEDETIREGRSVGSDMGVSEMLQENTSVGEGRRDNTESEDV